MKTKENFRYKKENGFSAFSSNEVAEIGNKIEYILSKNKIETDERNILEFLEAYLRLRINFLSGINAPCPYTKSLERARAKLNFSPKEINNLIFWARGSRKNKNETLSEKETEILYERIIEKLNPPAKQNTS